LDFPVSIVEGVLSPYKVAKPLAIVLVVLAGKGKGRGIF